MHQAIPHLRVRRRSTLPAVKEASVLAILAEATRDPTLDPVKMRELIAIQRDVEGQVRFNEAWLVMKAAIPRINREGKIILNNGGVIRFVPYEKLNEVVEPILLSHDFRVTHASMLAADQSWYVHTEIVHLLGYKIMSDAPILIETGNKAMNKSQAFNAGSTSAKRNNLNLLLNMHSFAPNDRDTGDGGMVEVKAASKKQKKEVATAIQTYKVPVEVFEKHYGPLDQLPERDVARALKACQNYKPVTEEVASE